jgi:cardiolipin synthase
VLVLDSRPLRGHDETASSLAAAIGAARDSAWITNAYFAPRPFTVDLLAEASQRGVDVRLLLPGPTDVPLVRHAGHGYFDSLLAAGIRIFEYQPRVLHAKTLVVDRHVAMVGSTNIDFRSFHFNAECNALVLDDVVGTTLALQFERDLVDAQEITTAAWRSRPWPHRVGDALAKRLAFLL